MTLLLLMTLMLAFGVVWMLGIGLSSGLGEGEGLAVAPAVGFMLTAVLGTYLTSADVPVSQWAVPFALCGAAANMVWLLMQRGRPAASIQVGDRAERRWRDIGFIVTCLVLVTTPAVGGLKFTILRGSADDFLNYNEMAVYLDRQPLSLVQKADVQTLADMRQSYTRARAMSHERWTTSMLLAMFARLGGAPTVAFDHYFMALSLICAYGPAFLLGKELKLSPLHAALAATVACTGFWTQMVMDMGAQSHVNSVPVLLFFAWLFIRLVEEPRSRLIEWALLILAGAALAFLYVEIMPMLLAALLLFAGLQAAKVGTSRKTLAFVAAGLASILAAAPSFHMLYLFLVRQVNVATGAKNDFHRSYFRWLYMNPLAGFWGFGYLETGPGHLIPKAVTILGGALMLVFIATLWKGLWGRSAGPRLVACAALASIGQFAYLALHEQYWAAGKVLSFGSAFFIFCVAGGSLGGTPLELATAGRPYHRLARALAMLLLLFQLGVGVYRPVMGAGHKELSRYVGSHYEYGRHHWDLEEIQRVVARQPGLTLWTDSGSIFMGEYLDLMLGQMAHVINVGPDRDVADVAGSTDFPRASLLHSPDYLIIANGFVGSPSEDRHLVKARTKELTLLQVDPTRPLLAGLQNPNGVETSPQGRFFWMANDPTVLTVFSPDDHPAELMADVELGPCSTRPFKTIIVEDGQTHENIVRTGPLRIKVTLHRGGNRILLRIKEPASEEKRVAGDRRPLLLLGVRGLSIQPCSP